MPSEPIENGVARQIARVVLLEALGSSATPFVPVPFVDDYLFERLLRRIARKVIERGGTAVDPVVPKGVAEGYVRAGTAPIAQRALTAAGRFVIRKVAIILDVKKSHDVFGEALAFALALDVAVTLGAVRDVTALSVGGAVYRATQSVGSAAIEALTRAARTAFQESGGAADALGRVVDAIGRELDTTRAHLDHLVRYELEQPDPRR